MDVLGIEVTLSTTGDRSDPSKPGRGRGGEGKNPENETAGMVGEISLRGPNLERDKLYHTNQRTNLRLTVRRIVCKSPVTRESKSTLLP